MKHAKKLCLIICLILCALLLLSCGPNLNWTPCKDYYGEYGFEIPFEYKKSNYAGLYFFRTDITMEQMRGELNEAGYTASIHDNDNVKKIFIVAEKNGFSYYYVIYDNNYLDSDVYTLRDCSATVRTEIEYPSDTRGGPSYRNYVFLFPLQYSDGSFDVDLRERKIYCTFDEFAAFYTATGKADAQIDYENKTVTFFCQGKSSYKVILKYAESENGNYINISLP